MRILVLSDLHFEQDASFTLPSGLDFDVAVLAGDINSLGRRAIHWARRESTFGGRPVVYVPGNHEFYRAAHIEHELGEMKRAGEGTNVHLLNRESVIIDGVRFLGCILWTDFQLPIRVGDSTTPRVGQALEVARSKVYDYQFIKLAHPATPESRYQDLKVPLRPGDTWEMHWKDREWLRGEFLRPFEGPTIVVTHHAPSIGSVADRYAGDDLTPAFVSHLPDEFFECPALWVHGHTHTTADYLRGSCRVLSNPRGYKRPDGYAENAHFNPRLVVEVPGPCSFGSTNADVASGRLQPELRNSAVGMTSRSGWVTKATPAGRTGAEALASRRDMVDIHAAAELAKVTQEEMSAWMTGEPQRVIAFRLSQGWRLPRWQFEPWLWPVAQQLPRVLGDGGIAALAWLETPHGAFGGLNPRSALEQGESPERVLAIAAAE